MEIARAAVGFAVAVVLGTALLSGPVVDAIDLTGETSKLFPAEGSGNASVAVVSVPTDDVTLVPGRFGAGSYHFEAPPARVRVDSVAGDPVLRYVVFVRSLNVAVTREVPIGGRTGEVVRLRPGTAEISPKAKRNRTYDARVSIFLQHGGNRYRTLYQSNATVRVED